MRLSLMKGTHADLVSSSCRKFGYLALFGEMWEIKLLSHLDLRGLFVRTGANLDLPARRGWFIRDGLLGKNLRTRRAHCRSLHFVPPGFPVEMRGADDLHAA